jgi:hypothetical protein
MHGIIVLVAVGIWRLRKNVLDIEMCVGDALSLSI